MLRISDMFNQIDLLTDKSFVRIRKEEKWICSDTLKETITNILNCFINISEELHEYKDLEKEYKPSIKIFEIMTQGKVRYLLDKLRKVKRELTDERLINDLSEVEIYLNGMLAAYEIHDSKG